MAEVSDSKQITALLKPGRILLPVLLGLGVTLWFFLKEFNPETFRDFTWTSQTTLWIGIAVLMLVVRDVSYMVRIRVLTDYKLTWYRSFIVIMLWEFASALAPGLIGGGFFFAMFILNREGINMGKSITAILFSSFLDGIFLAVMAPFVYFVAGKEALFSGVQTQNAPAHFTFYLFWSVYFIILAYKLFVAYALFINPHFIKALLYRLFSLPFLNRWKRNAIETGQQLLIASNELKKENWKYWFYSLTSTFASWTARYTIVNCLIHAFHGDKPVQDFVVYGKQVIMGIIILFSPTPGGSGVAEFMFKDFLGEFIAPGFSTALGFLWRLLSYYPYIIVGIIILPRWIRLRFTNAEKMVG